MSLFSKLFGSKTKAVGYPQDELTIKARDLKITFFAHASLAIEF